MNSVQSIINGEIDVESWTRLKKTNQNQQIQILAEKNPKTFVEKCSWEQQYTHNVTMKQECVKPNEN